MWGATCRSSHRFSLHCLFIPLAALCLALPGLALPSHPPAPVAIVLLTHLQLYIGNLQAGQVTDEALRQVGGVVCGVVGGWAKGGGSVPWCCLRLQHHLTAPHLRMGRTGRQWRPQGGSRVLCTGRIL